MNKRRIHEMDLWPDMTIRVEKQAKMGVSSTISRTDFNRLGEVHEILAKMGFSEVRIIRKLTATFPARDETDVFKMVEQLEERALRERLVEIINSMGKDDLKRSLLTLLTYSKKDFLL